MIARRCTIGLDKGEKLISRGRLNTVGRCFLAVLTTLVFTFIAVALIAPQTSASENDSSQGISITVRNDGQNHYRLVVHNNGQHAVSHISSTTSLPSSLRAYGLQSTYSWTTGAIPVGSSVTVQSHHRDLVLSPRSSANQTEHHDASHASAKSSKTTKSSKYTTTNTKSAANKKAKQNSTGLVTTGTAVMAIVPVAAVLALIGSTLIGANGTLLYRRSARVAAVVISVALIAGVSQIGLRPTQAETQTPAATSTSATANETLTIPSTMTYNGQKYTLTSTVNVSFENPAAHGDKNTFTSQQYAKKMGAGWNLGNQFEAVNTDESQPDLGEQAWGNPRVSRSLIHSIKTQGFSNIRIPVTLYRRSSENGDTWHIDQKWLKRYKQVVDWARDEGLYVVIDLHGDAWTWMKLWDGKTSSPQYSRYVDYWKDLATYFADEPGTVSFETLNEPQFDTGTDEEKIARLTTLDKAAYDAIRAVPGNETRMIIVQTLGADSADAKMQATRDFIHQLNDPYVMASIHYYSEWVFSADLGKTRFDEKLFDGQDVTPRTSIDQLMNRLTTTFTNAGIGMYIGEFGLLAYDASSDGALQSGEELKYYDTVQHEILSHGFADAFWDNGSGIDRTTAAHAWKKPAAGRTLLNAAAGRRSSYSKDLNTAFLAEEPTRALTVGLELNGNTFSRIADLREGTDYTYDPATATISFTPSYLKRIFTEKKGTGICAQLQFIFSAGPAWDYSIVRVAQPQTVAKPVSGTRSAGIDVPVNFNGNEVMNITATENGKRVGPNSSWWQWLQNGEAFRIQYATEDRSTGTVTICPSFFADSTVKDGNIVFTITFQNGMKVDVPVTVTGDAVTYSPTK